MKNPKKREVTDREDMMCPRCQKEGLEPNPAYEDEYEGRVEIVKATRCSNEECPYHRGLPEEKVKMQMPEKGIGDILESFGTSPKDMAMFVGGFAVIVMLAWSYGIGPFGSSDTTPTQQTVEASITGNVLDYDGEYPEIQLYNNGNLVTSTQASDGDYVVDLDDVDPGMYDVYLNYTGSHYNPPGETIEISEEQEEDIELDLLNTPEPLDINIEQSASRSEFSIDTMNPNNVRGFELDISPIEGETVERERPLSTLREENVVLPIFPSSQEYRVEAPYTVEEFSMTESYAGQPESYEVFGNAPAEEITIELPDETEADSVVRTVDVGEGGEFETISVASQETLGDVEVTLRDGTSSEMEQASGKWEGQQNETIATGTDEFVQGTLQIEPEPLTNDQRVEDVISGNEIGHQFEGNMPITDAEIEFVGGDIEASLEGIADVSVDAEDGTTEEIISEVTTVDSDGSYRLEWDQEIQDNENLVELFYQINGDRETVSFDDSRTLSLNEGDVVEIGAKAELETMVPDQEEPDFASELDDDFEIVDVSFSDENPGTNERIEVEVTVENTGPSQVSDTVELYQNHNMISDERITLDPSEQTTLGLFEFGEPTTSDTSGVEVWYINDIGPYFLDVAIGERSFGVGSLEAELLNVGTEGEILVDTDGSGNMDCEADASGGVCEFDELESGFNSISVEEVGVSDTSFVLEYTSQENPRGIQIDVGEDGITDLQHDGILTGAESTSVELPPDEATVGMIAENEIPFSYGLTWQSDAVIDNPVVDIDGEPVISGQETFVENRTFEVGTLEQGDHTFRFRSDTGGYTAEIEWREEEEQSFPRAIVNNQVACEPPEFADDLSCVVDEDVGYSPGTHTIEFEQAPNEIFDFRVEQDARAVASNVEINVDGTTSEVFSRPTLDAEPWEQVSSTSDITRGENLVSIDVEEENNILPEVNVDLLYLLDTATVEELEVEVENPETDEVNTIQTPDDPNVILQDTTLEIEEDWMSQGENIVRLNPEPIDGIFEIEGDIVINENETFEFRTLG